MEIIFAHIPLVARLRDLFRQVLSCTEFKIRLNWVMGQAIL